MSSKRSAAVAMAIILGIAGLAGCSNESELTDLEYLQKAKVELDKRDIRTSAIHLRSALQVNPDNAEARWLLGTLYLEVNDGPSAQKELERAMGLGIPAENLAPDLSQALLIQHDYSGVLKLLEDIHFDDPMREAELLALRGEAQLGLGEYERSEELFSQALKLDYASTGGLIGTAKLAMIRGNWDAARKTLEKATELSPESVPAWILVGNLEFNRKNYEKAREAYGHAIEYSYFNVTAYLQRALAAMELGDLDAAEKDLKAVQNAAPRYTRITYVKGLLQFKREKYDDASNTFTDVLNKSPDNISAKYYLAASHFAMGRYNQAENHLASVVAAQPRFIQARLLLGAVHLKQGNLDAAERILLPTAELVPDHSVLMRLLGELYFAKGQPDRSVAYLSKATERNSADTTARLGLGAALLETGDTEGGLDVLEKLAETDSASGKLALYLGLMKVGEYDRAAGVAEEIAAANPDAPAGKLLLANAFRVKGDLPAARKVYEEVLEMDKGNPEASLRLADMAMADGDEKRAEQLYRDTLKYYPGHVVTTMRLVEIETRAGDMAAAKDLLEAAIARNPDELVPRIFLANYFRNRAEPARALSLLEQVDERWSQDPRYLFSRAEAEIALKQYASAERTLNTLLRTMPGTGRAFLLMGLAKLGLDQPGQARESFARAVELEPGNIQAQVSLARAQFLNGQRDDARERVAMLKAKYPDSAEVLALQGWLAMRSGDPEAASRALEQAARKAATTDLVIDLARMQWESLQFDRASSVLDAWLERYPDDVRALFEKGSFLLMRNEPADARKAFEQVVRRDPEHVASLNNLAWLYRKDDVSKAMGFAEKSYELSPGDPVVMDTYAVVLLEDGATGKALRMIDRALESAPENPSIQYHKAMILAREGDTEQARQLLEKALRDGGKFLERSEAMAFLEQLQ